MLFICYVYVYVIYIYIYMLTFTIFILTLFSVIKELLYYIMYSEDNILSYCF